MIGFEIVSFTKLVPGSHQKCSHLWQAEVLIFVTSGHINHNCSQLSFVKISHNSRNWSKFSLLITIFTIIKSHLLLVLNCKNYLKWSKLSRLFKIVAIVQNCNNQSKLSHWHNFPKLSHTLKMVQIGPNCHNWSQLL